MPFLKCATRKRPWHSPLSSCSSTRIPCRAGKGHAQSDRLRRGRMLARKHGMVALDMVQEQQAMPDMDSALDDDIGDELLRLIFTACHPRLSREARAALALRMICGLTTEEIARAFLLPE